MKNSNYYSRFGDPGGLGVEDKVTPPGFNRQLVVFGIIITVLAVTLLFEIAFSKLHLIL
mgnify:CR=1 FL=1